MRLAFAALALIFGILFDFDLWTILLIVAAYQTGAFLSDKDIDGEKIIKGIPYDNSSLPNYKRTHAGSLRWSAAHRVLSNLKEHKSAFYIDNFRFMDPRTKNHFSLFGKWIANNIEKKNLYLKWSSLKKGSLVVGSMGQGKTEFLLNIMSQYMELNQKMVIHDTKSEFTEFLYREDKDYILNHLESRGLYWDFYIDNERGLPVSIILDFFHSYFIAVAGERADKYWTTMAAKRFEDTFNEVKIDDNIPINNKMQEFLLRIIIYFDVVKNSENKTEQSIAATLEASLDIFLKMLYMKSTAHHDDNNFKLFLFTEFFESRSDTRIFLHSVEEISRVNTPFVAGFLTVLFRIQLSIVSPKPEDHILYVLDEYLTFFSLLSSDLKKSLHTKSRSTGAILLPAIQYLPKDDEDLKNLLSSVENLYYFATTDPDTNKKISELIGQTHITRIHKTSNKKPDLKEEKIDLIDENIQSLLRVGHHISFYPKNKAILYIGYTKQVKMPKISKGYIRQTPSQENDFILFKQNLITD